MNIDRLTNLVITGGLILAATAALAQDAARKPHVPLEKTIGQVTPTGPVPSLAVINSAGAKIENGKLVLTGVSANSIVFADRPVRAAGHVTTEQFIMQWDEGKNNFAVDPPNATVSVLGGDGSDVSDAVVTLKTPKLDGNRLTFDVAVLEGSLSGAAGPAAVFIDHFGGSFGGGGFAGGGFRGGDFSASDFHGSYGRVGDDDFAHVGGAYWHAPVYHGAWYRGAPVATGAAVSAAVGAAAVRPYYNPYYYPYYGAFNAFPECGTYPLPSCY